MTYRIAKRFTFKAAHSLPRLQKGRKSKPAHSHSYTVELVLHGDMLDKNGFIVDYGEITEKFGVWLKKTVDHRDLNKVLRKRIDRHSGHAPESDAPTAENLSRWFFNVATHLLENVESVRVWEADASWASYSGEIDGGKQ